MENKNIKNVTTFIYFLLVLLILGSAAFVVYQRVQLIKQAQVYSERINAALVEAYQSSKSFESSDFNSSVSQLFRTYKDLLNTITIVDGSGVMLNRFRLEPADPSRDPNPRWQSVKDLKYSPFNFFMYSRALDIPGQIGTHSEILFSVLPSSLLSQVLKLNTLGIVGLILFSVLAFFLLPNREKEQKMWAVEANTDSNFHSVSEEEHDDDAFEDANDWDEPATSEETDLISHIDLDDDADDITKYSPWEDEEGSVKDLDEEDFSTDGLDDMEFFPSLESEETGDSSLDIADLIDGDTGAEDESKIPMGNEEAYSEGDDDDDFELPDFGDFASDDDADLEVENSFDMSALGEEESSEWDILEAGDEPIAEEANSDEQNISDDELDTFSFNSSEDEDFLSGADENLSAEDDTEELSFAEMEDDAGIYGELEDDVDSPSEGEEELELSESEDSIYDMANVEMDESEEALSDISFADLQDEEEPEDEISFPNSEAASVNVDTSNSEDEESELEEFAEELGPEPAEKQESEKPPTDLSELDEALEDVEIVDFEVDRSSDIYQVLEADLGQLGDESISVALFDAPAELQAEIEEMAQSKGLETFKYKEGLALRLSSDSLEENVEALQNLVRPLDQEDLRIGVTGISNTREKIDAETALKEAEYALVNSSAAANITIFDANDNKYNEETY